MKKDMDQPENAQPQIWMPLLLCIMVALGMIFGGKMQASGPILEVVRYHDTLGTATMEGKLEELIRYIDARYVDQIGRDSLVQEAISSLMGHLDPHSNYLPPEEVIRLKESREGIFTGIGVEFIIESDTLHILRVLPGSPAEEKGLLPGDRVLIVNDSLLVGASLTSEKARSILAGEQGSRVRMKIDRQGTGIMDIRLRRASIRIPSVSEGVMLDSVTGYVRIHRFGANTYREFMESIEDLHKASGMKDMLIDLRGNPGGYLHEAINILSQLFAEKDRLLVYTVGRESDRREYMTSGRRFFEVNRVVVLVDENSASASEILAGAIQDWDRGLIAGRRTFGKGLVQEQYGLRDGSAIVLTIARYYTPSGRSIQRDYSDVEAYQRNDRGQQEQGITPQTDAKKGTASKIYSTYNGRSVYGGGGIDPDVLIGYDIAQDRPELKKLLDMVPSFQLSEIREQHAGKAQLNDLDGVWKRFGQWVQAKDKTLGQSIKDAAFASLVRRQVLGQVAHYIGGEMEQTRFNASRDPEIQEALKLFHEGGVFEKLL